MDGLTTPRLLPRQLVAKAAERMHKCAGSVLERGGASPELHQAAAERRVRKAGGTNLQGAVYTTDAVNAALCTEEEMQLRRPQPTSMCKAKAEQVRKPLEMLSREARFCCEVLRARRTAGETRVTAEPVGGGSGP